MGTMDEDFFIIAKFLRKVTCNALKTLRLFSSSVLEAILKQDGATNEFKDCFVLLIDVSTVFRFNILIQVVFYIER